MGKWGYGEMGPLIWNISKQLSIVLAIEIWTGAKMDFDEIWAAAYALRRFYKIYKTKRTHFLTSCKKVWKMVFLFFDIFKENFLLPHNDSFWCCYSVKLRINGFFLHFFTNKILFQTQLQCMFPVNNEWVFQLTLINYLCLLLWY